LWGTVDPPALFRAAALTPFVRSSFGEVVDEFRGCVADLGPVAGPAGVADEHTTARRLTLLGLSLRPALLAPAAGATLILQSVAPLDGAFPAIGRVRQAVVGFGAANIELSPSVLKGVQDHAQWAVQLQQIRDEAKDWLQRNRSGKIIYAATTDVWHQWLREDGLLGQPLRLVIDNRQAEDGLARKAVKSWTDPKWVGKQLHATDLAIRKNTARRKPIEARARNEVCDRAQEFVRIVGGWLEHLAGEPHTLDDYRQQRADEVRGKVSNALPDAVAEIDRASSGGTALLAAAARFLRRALHDLQQLFDPTRAEAAETPPVRILLGEELLAIPDMDLTDAWRPEGPADTDRLNRLLALRVKVYNPKTAFDTHTERRNHIRTGQVI
jgi:hypothetical protein